MTAADVAALRSQLWEAGFRPLAIYSQDADVSDAGKRPIGTSWQERARRNPPAAVVEHVEAVALNTGVLCDGLRALDIDIDDTAVAAQVQRLALRTLGEAPTRWRPNSRRRLLLYRAAEGEPRKNFCKGKFGAVEVLGRGQQFVAYGVHPTGAALAWHPADPAAVGLRPARARGLAAGR
jgi:bifunctional DNA primase/polymerase-like protein